LLEDSSGIQEATMYYRTCEAAVKTTTMIFLTMPSWKSLAEIDTERARYLLSADDMLEEMLGKT